MTYEVKFSDEAECPTCGTVTEGRSSTRKIGLVQCDNTVIVTLEDTDEETGSPTVPWNLLTIGPDGITVHGSVGMDSETELPRDDDGSKFKLIDE